MYGGGGGGNQYDGGASFFAGGGFMPSQATQTPDSSSSFAKNRGSQGVLPLTVKQISEAYHSNDDKSSFAVDGIDASNVKLLGIVMNKAERVTDICFSLDDGTGKIDVTKWVHEACDTEEMALIENGMYVSVNGSLKGFQGKKQVVAFAVRVREHGLHVDEVVKRLGLPLGKIMEAITYHVDVGSIYSTIDDSHFKSAVNG